MSKSNEGPRTNTTPVSAEALVVLLLSLTAFPALLQVNSRLATLLAEKNRLFGFLEAIRPSTVSYFAYDQYNGLLTCLGALLLMLYLAVDLLGNTAGRHALPGPPGLTRFFASHDCRIRNWLLVGLLLLFVAFPTVYTMGLRHVGTLQGTHDGGVLHTEAAMDLLLQGENPYAADYRGTEFERVNRENNYWKNYGRIPHLEHYPYLPFSFVAALPLQLVSNALLGWYDQRLFYLLTAFLAAWVLWRMATDGSRRRMLLAAIFLNPYFTQFFIEGRNDILLFLLVIASLLALQRGRMTLSLALLTLACCTKQFAWVLVPFHLLLLAGSRAAGSGPLDLLRSAATQWRRALLPAGICALLILPFMVWSPDAFIDDTLRFNAGQVENNYPLGGTPGFGAANLVLWFQLVASRNDYFPFIIPLVLVGLPVVAGLLLLQQRRNSAAMMLSCGSLALLVLAFFSRLFHDNHLGLILMWITVAALADDFRCGGESGSPENAG